MKQQVRSLLSVLLVASGLAIGCSSSAKTSDELAYAPDAESIALNDPLQVTMKFWTLLKAQQIEQAGNLLADNVLFTNSSGQVIASRIMARNVLRRYDFKAADLCDVWIKGDMVIWTVRVSTNGVVTHQSGWTIVSAGKIQVLGFGE
jgi:hypothetical protein